MLYLSHFSFPGEDAEYGFVMRQKRTCYDSIYPFKILSKNELTKLSFEPITILCGGNGSGKTTALNVIAEALSLKRDTLYNRSNFFEEYIEMCDYRIVNSLPEDSRVVTSDDVFDYILNLRSINEGIDERREELLEDYLDLKYADFHFRTMEDYEKLKKVNLSRRTTQSQYVRKSVMDNVRENSNGESAFRYFVEKIDKQEELIEYIENSAGFFGSQFIIATHSPFLLSLKGARIYDLNQTPVMTKKWTEIETVRKYYEFFKAHSDEFKERGNTNGL